MIIFPFPAYHNQIPLPYPQHRHLLGPGHLFSGGYPHGAGGPAFLDLLKIFNITVSFITLVGVILLFENTANRAEAKLQEEYQRAENLLHNILPVSIAQRLKRGRRNHSR
jgi:hypothetical protein